MLSENKKKYDKHFWAARANNKDYIPLIDEVKEMYEEATKAPIPTLTYSMRMSYYQNGDRSAFSYPFMMRRKRMYSSAILSLLYPENEEYFINLQDSVWAIMDEFCWAGPHHVDNTIDAQDKTIDLSAAQTAYALSDIYLLFEARLDDIIKKRIKREIKAHIIDVFLNYEQNWEKNETNNWLPVNICGIGCSVIRLFPELYDRLEPRLTRAINTYIDCFPNDGACLEGGGYWNFGFSHYVWYSETVYDYTNGKTDFLSSEKIKQIASFNQKLFLKGDCNISFADSPRSFVPKIALSYYLAKKFPETNKIISNRNGFTLGNSWGDIIGAFLYYDSNLPKEEALYGTHIFPDAKWYITTKERYSFAIKAGDNDEPHNHNDIGTFIISTDYGQEIADVGHGKYVKEYFDKNKRYTIFCTSSFSHSVPVINGECQKAGKSFGGDMEICDGSVVIDMKNAYNLPSLKKLERTFTPKNDRVILKDSWNIDFESFKERFISPFEPVLTEGEILLKNVRICYDKRMADVKISQNEHLCHFEDKTEKIYCIDLEVKQGISEFSAEFIIR